MLVFAFFPLYADVGSGDAAAVIPENAATMSLQVKGLDCEACASTIRDSLRNVPDVVEASVSYDASTATCAYRDDLLPAEEALVAAIRRAGFEAERERR